MSKAFCIRSTLQLTSDIRYTWPLHEYVLKMIFLQPFSLFYKFGLPLSSFSISTKSQLAYKYLAKTSSLMI